MTPISLLLVQTETGVKDDVWLLIMYAIVAKINDDRLKKSNHLSVHACMQLRADY